MKIFLSVPSFKSEYGGPAYTVLRLGQVLGQLGHTIGLWAADGSAVGLENTEGCRYFKGSLNRSLDSFGIPDVIHDNGLWTFENHAVTGSAVKHDIPLVISPRGMLEPWSLEQSQWRKKLALLTYQKRDLRKASRIHATSEAEADNFCAIIPGLCVDVIPNGIDLPDGGKPTDKSRNVRTALFLSRIHPKKGIELLLSVWKQMRPQGWRLRIVGPGEESYRSEIKRLVADYGLESLVKIESELLGEKKADAFSRADLFILPSYSENFGVVVAEALSFGVPVVTTKGTPWQILENARCGWWVEANCQSLAESLAEAMSLSSDVLQEMGARGRELAETQYSWLRVATMFQRSYEKAL